MVERIKVKMRGASYMTDAQKQEILRLRNQGLTFTEIAEAQGLNRNTVKTYVSRFKKKLSLQTKCLNCGDEIEQKPKTRKKKFCCDACRIYYWNHKHSKHNRAGVEFAQMRRPKKAATGCVLPAPDGARCSMSHSQFQRELDYGIAVSIWKKAFADGVIDMQDFCRVEKMYIDRYCPIFRPVPAIDNANINTKAPR